MTATPLPTQDLLVRDAEPADAPALLALHCAGFASGWTMAAWRHRYGPDPWRRARIVGAFDRQGGCLATFGGVLLPCRLGEDAAWVVRGGDVVVDKRLRATAAGPRVLLRVIEAFVAGFKGTDVAMIFGFPVAALTRTLIGQCRFEVMGDVAWLARAAADFAPGPDAIAAAVVGDLPADLAALLAVDAEEYGHGLVRDLDYLDWRYRRSPLGEYAVVTARAAGGALRGAAIVRCDAPQGDAVMVVEWFVPRDDDDAAAALLARIASLGRARGRSQVVTCCAGSDPTFRTLQLRHGFHVTVSPYQFVFRSLGKGTAGTVVTRRGLFERWRYSGGDLDFL